MGASSRSAGQSRALLASLLLRANSVVGRDVLIEELWGGDPPASAAHSLEVYVSRLRRLLPGRLETRDGGYLLRVDPPEVDATRLEELLDAARRARAAGDATRAVERVDAALALWRGPALSGLELVGALAAEAAPVQALTRTASMRRRPGHRDPLSHPRTHISLGTSAPHIRPKDQSQCQQSDQTRL